MIKVQQDNQDTDIIRLSVEAFKYYIHTYSFELIIKQKRKKYIVQTISMDMDSWWWFHKRTFLQFFFGEKKLWLKVIKQINNKKEVNKSTKKVVIGQRV